MQVFENATRASFDLVGDRHAGLERLGAAVDLRGGSIQGYAGGIGRRPPPCVSLFRLFFAVHCVAGAAAGRALVFGDDIRAQIDHAAMDQTVSCKVESLDFDLDVLAGVHETDVGE